MKAVTINEAQLQILLYFGIFLFTSLVGIIVWLAKKVDEKVEKISQLQNTLNVNIVTIGKDLETVKTDVSYAKESIKEIPTIKLQIGQLSQLVGQNNRDFYEIKDRVTIHEKAINDMKLLMARHFKIDFINETDKG